jgi:hypothetical protein
LDSSIEAGDSRIDRGGTIHTGPVKSRENIIEPHIISRREFAVIVIIIIIITTVTDNNNILQ